MDAKWNCNTLYICFNSLNIRRPNNIEFSSVRRLDAV